jgi:hypothetical protein
MLKYARRLTTNDDVTRLQKDLDDLHERHIELQARTVRENLIFTEIPLKEKYKTSEITVKIIKNFITVQLKLTKIPYLGWNYAHWCIMRIGA